MKKTIALFVCLCLCILNIWSRQTESFTPLQQAVLAGDYTKAVRLLDENPDSIDDPSGDENIETASGEEVYVEGATALHIALAVQDERMVQLLVDRGADLYLTDYDDWDAMLYAVSYSSVPCLEILLDIDSKLLSRRYSSNYDSTPLHWAARYNTADMVRYLVETCGMDVNVRDEDGDTPLDYAAWGDNYDVDVIEYLESAGGLYGGDIPELTLLQQAVLAGDYTKAVRLLDENPDSIDDPSGDEYIETASGKEVYIEGAAALHIALAVQDERMVQLLVDRGADLYLTDYDDWDAMLYAVSYSSVPCLEILLDIDSKLLSRRYSSNYDSTPLHWAARYNTADMVRYLVETCGMDVNVRDEDGDTPLDYAAWGDNYDVDVIEYLESAGGLYGGDIPELTLLQQAVLAGDYTKAVRLLDEDPGSIDDPAGDENIETSSGEEVYVEGATALHIALAVQDERMVRLLVDWGADLYLTDDDDWDAVLYAVSFSSVPCLEILLEKEEGLLSRRYSEYYDSTPLHWAARLNTVDMVRYLVETCGMDVNVRDEDRDTPLDYADWNNNYDTMDYLESAGALFNQITPLQQAVLAGDYTKAVRLLDEDPDSIDAPAGDKYIKTASGEEVYVEGATALHIALAVQDKQMVQLLVDRGADLYLTDDDDWDAMLYAVSYSSVPCLEILLEKEEGLLSRRYSEYYDSTPLHWAARYNTVDMVRYLVETCGMDVNVRDEDRDTPLDYADWNDNYDVMKYLESTGSLY